LKNCVGKANNLGRKKGTSSQIPSQTRMRQRRKKKKPKGGTLKKKGTGRTGGSLKRKRFLTGLEATRGGLPRLYLKRKPLGERGIVKGQGGAMTSTPAKGPLDPNKSVRPVTGRPSKEGFRKKETAGAIKKRPWAPGLQKNCRKKGGKTPGSKKSLPGEAWRSPHSIQKKESLRSDRAVTNGRRRRKEEVVLPPAKCYRGRRSNDVNNLQEGKDCKEKGSEKL